jgi:hypothetical protein
MNLKKLLSKNILIKCAVIIGAFGVGFGALIFSKKPDGFIEQGAEAVLRTQGIDIDLSPESNP